MTYGFGDILSLLGALALFLYGMRVMSDALMELAGNRLRAILATTTANRLFAVATGVVITALIQSSSATTLMTVSFVNAGLLTLTEAVGVIMGANVGTTVTAWLISILGFKVSMSAIALPVLGAGFVLSLAQAPRRRHWGLFVLGFALLFLGLDFLQGSLPDVGENPEMLRFLAAHTRHGMASVLLFLAIGTVMTLVVQSSSAAMALTLVMCFQGWLPFDMAAAMVLGQNVATTVTANLAALVANTQAKQAALAHLVFNLLGVAWTLVFFSPLVAAVGSVVTAVEGVSPFAAASAVPVALSLFHTVFNVLNTLLLIAFVPQLVRLVEWAVPARAAVPVAMGQAVFLDESSLRYPQTGIKALNDESLRLLQNAAYQVIAHGLNVHRADLESAQKLHALVAEEGRIPIDIDRFYATQIKTVYNRILEYATRLQSDLNLSEPEIEAIRNILVADRMLVQVVKRLKPLRENSDRYGAMHNPTIRREYNVLRHRILKVIREIHRIAGAPDPAPHFEKLRRQREKARELDVLATGRLDKLVLSGEVSPEMASSLANDSATALRIAEMLVDVATLLYNPRDTLTARIDEAQAGVPCPGPASATLPPATPEKPGEGSPGG